MYDAEYYTKVSKGRGQMPAVFIIYDMFSLAVAVTDSRRSLAHFLVRVCAVLGGVFAVSRASISPSSVQFLIMVLLLVLSKGEVATMSLLAAAGSAGIVNLLRVIGCMSCCRHDRPLLPPVCGGDAAAAATAATTGLIEPDGEHVLAIARSLLAFVATRS